MTQPFLTNKATTEAEAKSLDFRNQTSEIRHLQEINALKACHDGGNIDRSFGSQKKKKKIKLKQKQKKFLTLNSTYFSLCQKCTFFFFF